MSLARLIYYGAVIGGWATLVGWGLSEFLQSRIILLSDWMDVILTTTLVGAALGAGLNVVAGAANTQWKRQLRRVGVGLGIGAAGGFVGGLIGNFVNISLGLPKALGWIILGACIGVVDGLTERSWTKLRNGFIGGIVGGILGGILMQVMGFVALRSGMLARSLALVLLGMCIGAFVAFVKVALREAWLTVEDGYRPGRQLILSQRVTVLGRGEQVDLPFFSRPGTDLEPEHSRIIRQADGHYDIEDNHTRLGTWLNGQQIRGRSPLKDGDVIKLGTNITRFRERYPQPDVPPTPSANKAASSQARAVAPAVQRPPVAPAQAVPPPTRPTQAPPRRAASPRPEPPVGPVSIGKCPQCGRRFSGVAGYRTCAVCKTTF
jgi:hypothetical protein